MNEFLDNFDKKVNNFMNNHPFIGGFMIVGFMYLCLFALIFIVSLGA